MTCQNKGTADKICNYKLVSQKDSSEILPNVVPIHIYFAALCIMYKSEMT